MLILTIWLVKSVTLVLKLTGQGRGTALPGLIVEKYLPWVIPAVMNLSPYTILITGTNGKTTTRTLLAKILESNGDGVLQNRSGSNLLRGILSEILNQSTLLGKVRANYAVFEVEEASMPRLGKLLKPEQIIITNLFRDQLDAYGEIDRTLQFIQTAISANPQATIILNADDPKLASLATSENTKVIRFGLEQKHAESFSYEGKSAWTRTDKLQRAHDITISPDLTTSFKFQNAKFIMQLPGIYQVYNALAAIVSSSIVGISLDSQVTAIADTAPAFGRGEIINYRGVPLRFLLMKNPSGLNSNLQLISQVSKNPILVFVLNDNTADGKDVSWIWDANLEILKTIRPKEILCSGIRAEDMLLRVKYVYGNPEQTSLQIIPDSKQLLKKFNQTDSQYFILPTYTAMLELRKLLTGNALNV